MFEERENLYFHGIGCQTEEFDKPTYINLCLKNLESIIKTGYICCRKSIEEKGIDAVLINEKNSNFNGDENVSLCFNPEDVYLGDCWHDHYTYRSPDSAYDMYVRNGIAIVFDEDVTEGYVVSGCVQDDEIQIKGDISFKKAIAIAVNVDENYLEETVKRTKMVLKRNNVDLPIISTTPKSDEFYIKLYRFHK